MDPHVKLAATLVYGATLDYHSYHNTKIRRRSVLQATRSKRGKVDNVTLQRLINRHLERLWGRAEAARQWMTGEDAPMPFALCAHALGWDEHVLAERIFRADTGENLDGS